jgi:hypothetical protein
MLQVCVVDSLVHWQIHNTPQLKKKKDFVIYMLKLQNEPKNLVNYGKRFCYQRITNKYTHTL